MKSLKSWHPLGHRLSICSRNWGKPKDIWVKLTGVWDGIGIWTSRIRSKSDDRLTAIFETIMLICLFIHSYPVSFEPKKWGRPIGEFLVSDSFLNRYGDLTGISLLSVNTTNFWFKSTSLLFIKDWHRTHRNMLEWRVVFFKTLTHELGKGY